MKERSVEEAAKNADMDSFDAFEKFVEGVKHLDVPRVSSKENAWQRLEQKISEKEHSPKVTSISRRNWVIGVAASFILALGAFFLLPSANENKKSNYVTNLAESRMIYLPDSSSVHLNAVSTVSFSKNNWKEERVVLLEGEAFFEVKRGSKFSVVTPKGTVSVLGTSFNVRLRNGELTVACKTGKVGVSKTESEEMITITPGEMVVLSEDGTFSEKLEVNTKRVASWINKEFDFESMSMKDVFKELERQYDIKIESNLDNTTLDDPMTGTIPTNNLDQAVQTLEFMKGIEAEVSSDGQTITFKRK